MKKFAPLLIATAAIALLLICPNILNFTYSHLLVSAESNWQLSITGLVRTKYVMTVSDLRSRPQITEIASLACVDNPSASMAGSWTGVSLAVLLQDAGMLPDATKIAFHAQDGYTTDLTIDAAQTQTIIVAYALNGQPISEDLRLVVPGAPGYKWIAYLTEIEVVNFDFLGKYESQGYADSVTILTVPTGSTSPTATNTPSSLPMKNSPLPPTTSPISPTPSQSPTQLPEPYPSTSPQPSQQPYTASQPGLAPAPANQSATDPLNRGTNQFTPSPSIVPAIPSPTKASTQPSTVPTPSSKFQRASFNNVLTWTAVTALLSVTISLAIMVRSRKQKSRDFSIK
jgi:hypothetical protein